MPHISKQSIKQSALVKIDELLLGSLFSKEAAGNGKEVFKSLLTDTERIMLAKRFAIIVLLDRGHSIYRITKSLKVSPSTVARLKENFEIYSPLHGRKRKGENGFLRSLEKFIQDMPSYVGKGRWKFLNEK